jgi:hypothetical protein
MEINLVSPQSEASKCTFQQFFFKGVATLAEKKNVTVERVEFLLYWSVQFQILHQDAACPTRVFSWFFIGPS